MATVRHQITIEGLRAPDEYLVFAIDDAFEPFRDILTTTLSLEAQANMEEKQKADQEWAQQKARRDARCEQLRLSGQTDSGDVQGCRGWIRR